MPSTWRRRRPKRARECHPDFYEFRVAQLARVTGPTPWWQLPELAEERAGGRIGWTEARIALAVEAVPYCTPETPEAPAHLVARAETFGPNVF